MSDNDPDHDERIRIRAHRLWLADGAPAGREDEYLERARELQGIEDNPSAGLLPNPMVASHGEIPPAQPIEEAALEENLGELPGRLTDEGDRRQTPMTRQEEREWLKDQS
jgi:hypothetical protein